MDQNIKQRLVGIAVIFALAVIFLPMVLDGSGVQKKTLKVEIPAYSKIPARQDFDEKMIELEDKVEAMTELEPRFVDEKTTTTQNRITRSEEKEAEARIVQSQQQTETKPAVIPKQEPVKKEPQKQVGGDSWVLQVGSFRDQQKAISQRDKLRQSKIAAVFIEQFNSGGQASYRVRLGPFADREKSKIAQNKIKAKYNIDGLIMKYERYAAEKHMSWLDLVIIGIILISALISLVRGFVKESISLVSWILAGFIAFIYFSALAELLLPYVESPTVRTGVAFSVLFVSTLIVGAIINFMASQMVSKTGLSGTDKTLGMVFGAARGVLIVTLIVLLASLTPMPEETWWQDAGTIKYFSQLANWLKEVLPQDISSRFPV